ncbi:ankyrin repeat domain-containing protein [Xanthomonas campestris]|uniref:ankyrin repeat domain-containing protein n=2 Tax=Xanthomonas campestris TaxID=339 RepID=UPI0005DF7152|nr:ankyrin repeat domain-containing protein [Xanthomonas campestris]MCC5053419.1 ankyrin repeat domain-containing protein [Xanthomonas campestris pv. aberrans]MDM7683515.1 ankyrin repeat domain-containing protein [Xanthomonas campestris pv. campestris]MDM7688952.1 ankyrin repeat domain-containing protein [Xanthomonas campestris pv. campestris]MDM7704401.1 ankyrin repeat domain-containing protein [Xanthomonas campestris pv. campestris]MDM7710060.1 ankyrin repeat domain-containing protein [Xanth
MKSSHCFIRFCCVVLLAITGCSPAAQSRYAPERNFTDPKALALALAAEQGDAEEVRRLMKVEGVNPDTIFSKDGYPLLFWPIFTHNPTGLKAMLDNGADPNVAKPYPPEPGRNQTNVSNAMVWAAEQDDPLYLKLLLDHGGNPNTRNANNESLLFHAFIKQNKWDNIKLLVERGADINAVAGMGNSITAAYAIRGGFDFVYWLLQHGADPTIEFAYGNPVHLKDSGIIEAIFWHPGNPKDPQWQRQCQQWLLKRGYERPPLPENYRSMRKAFHFPTEEKDIPLL